ncbi:hypothetical protein [Kocuria sp.]|uniref:hypothetical protein n=1 Tax=Kocuria sp. TaxID=1871328 RepID=UPI0026DEFCE2|nr:hypothetical protein [Kocuria sp.]MDO5617247.1 hypothetical protein [Kocuria sp.]
MSDQRYHLVYLEATSENVGRLSQELREWLRSEGWSIEAEGLSDWLSPSSGAIPADRYGPRMKDLARSLDMDYYDDETLTVYDSWEMYDGAQALEGVICLRCNFMVSDDDWDLYELGDEWMRTRVAPELTCPACGTTIPMDYWGLDSGVAVGTLAVTIELWDVRDNLRDALRERFPGRWAGIYQRI